jgi:hypothetical protein
MWKARLRTNLDCAGYSSLTINVTKNRQRAYRLKVDYDWLTWKYHLKGRSISLNFIRTDFENEWRAKCFMKYIYNRDLYMLLCTCDY